MSQLLKVKERDLQCILLACLEVESTFLSALMIMRGFLLSLQLDMHLHESNLDPQKNF